MSDLQKTIDVLNKKGFKAVCAADSAQAVAYVLSVIGKNDTVGAGGSMTLEQTGVVDALLKRGNIIYSSSVAKKLGQDKEKARVLAMTADVFISSTNAVTLEGDLINIDGIGNRVAGMFFGPKKVVIVTGKNKITANPLTAIERIKSIACPQNTRRLGLDTPCAKTGKCAECTGSNRICNVVVRIQYPPWDKEIHVVIIDGDFGF